MAKKAPEIQDYQYGFHDKDVSVFRTKKGLTREIVEEISKIKDEPAWMLEFRLKALDIFNSMPMPNWGGDLDDLDFD
ncbi:Fe-S cluster assembly protein SufB, partial [Mesorhizobium sp. M00.F.Ca.ET.186.01.1.1]